MDEHNEQALAASLSDDALLAELVKRRILKVELTPAELTVARLDGYTQEQHAAGIAAARDRMFKKRMIP